MGILLTLLILALLFLVPRWVAQFKNRCEDPNGFVRMHVEIFALGMTIWLLDWWLLLI